MFSPRQRSEMLAALLRREQFAMAEFIETLAQFDRERQWERLGHSSLFYYLHRELNLSAGAAYYRKTAAQLVQLYPEILDALRDGRLCITSVNELAKVITPENRADVIGRFFHASKRSAKAIVAEIRPVEQPPQRTVITSLRPACPAETISAPAHSAPIAVASNDGALIACASNDGAPTDSATISGAPTDGSSASGASSHVAPDGGCGGGLLTHPGREERAASGPTEARRVAPPQSSVEPLTAELSRLHVNVSKAFLGKLAAARDALSHSRVAAAIETILEAGLDLILKLHARRNGLVSKPRKATRPSSRPDYIPAEVKRAVWKRDEGRCQWVLASGGICGSTFACEYDHRIPRVKGGLSTAENVRILCRHHNQLAAREVLGDEYMDAAVSTARRRTAARKRARIPTGALLGADGAAQSASSRRRKHRDRAHGKFGFARMKRRASG